MKDRILVWFEWFQSFPNGSAFRDRNRNRIGDLMYGVRVGFPCELNSYHS